MKIAQIAPNAERVPQKKYGGTERVISALTEKLVARGHEVTLFASGDSITKAELRPTSSTGLRQLKIKDPYGANEWRMYGIGLAYSQQHDFDIIHDHNMHYSLPTANIAGIPTLMTLHGPLTPTQRKMYAVMNHPYFNSISKAQVRGTAGLNYIGNVYHGLEMQDYPFQEKHDEYLLFVGRLSPEKGPHFAIEVAQAFNIPLILAAKLDVADTKYFEDYIAPYLSDDLIHWVGEVDEKERNRLMSKAKCLLHPVQFREPFGLTLIEAMACGCPVIAFNKGSIPEVVENGATGFVVNDVEDMIDAVDEVGKIDRQKCRTTALEKFNADRMTDEYEKIYQQILDDQKQLVKSKDMSKPML